MVVEAEMKRHTVDVKEVHTVDVKEVHTVHTCLLDSTSNSS